VLSEQSVELVFEHTYTGSTKNSVVNVLLGKADAGVTLTPVFAQQSEEDLRKLRVLLTSDWIPSHPLCAHPRVSAKARNKIIRGVLGMAATEEGRKLLRQVRIPEPEAADYEKDYKALEGVQVKILSNWGK
jgi:phosphonate transport system substrate-binding protein